MIVEDLAQQGFLPICDSGAGGRRFEALHPDNKETAWKQGFQAVFGFLWLTRKNFLEPILEPKFI